MIDPVLTPEEWKRALEYGHGDPKKRDGIFEYADTPESQHYVAAVALHGQPFGFTWDDVDSLRERADELEEKAKEDFSTNRLALDDSHYSLGAAWAEDAAELDSLADRIEALLPPRTAS